MAAVKTPTELAHRVLDNLNFVRPGEMPSATQVAKIVDRWTEIHAELVDEKVAYWDAEAIPLSVFNRVAWLMAVEVAPTFGALPIVLAALAQPSAEVARSSCISKLRNHVSKSGEYEPMQVEIM